MKGLTTLQAEELLKKHGLNTISEQKKKSLLVKFFSQFTNFLTILLIVAALFSLLIGEVIDGVLIVSIVILNALFGLYQEAKAEGAIEALKKITITKIRVIRDGIQTEIESKFLVRGDVCFIEEGVKIPADGVIIEGMNLELNESVLTGESLPVPKSKDEEVFSGTIVSKGRGFFQINKTGMETKFGKIAQDLSVIDDSKTPLQKKLEDLTRLIGLIGIGAAIFVFIISFFRGSGYFPAFLLAISLAVAVVPEGLPAVMTITLSLGVKEMSRRKSIVRKLSAIEALGSVTLVATDKTGTLTTNKMKVSELFVDDKLYEIHNLPRLENHPFSLLVQNGIVCSTASLVYVHDHGRYDVLGDPTEGALLYLAHEVGIQTEEVRKKWVTIDENPFDSVTKRMSVVVSHQKEKLLFSKGAPESILEISNTIQKGNKAEPLTLEERKKIEDQMEKWTKKGLRVLAFSYKQLKSAQTKTDPSRSQLISTDLTFLGLVAIHDAPRPEVNEAVARAKNAGINVVMITGDNEKTAEAVGVVAGIIEEGGEILTGQQVENYSDKELLKILPRVKIFARTSPFHKHRIVKLYQELGEIVAVTGDGVNDAIALKQADVGVAKGLVGTDVARETADMVITDDNFATIVTAIEEGRNIINSIKNAIKYLLSCNVAEAIALIFGLILGLPTFFYPIQLLYINLVTDGLPALMLSFSPRDPNAMSISPEKEMVLLKRKDQSYIGAVGIVGAVLVITAYFIFAGQKLGGTAAFSVLTMIQSFVFIDLWLSHRHIHENIRHLFSPLFFLAFLLPLVLQLIILSHPFSAGIFKVLPVSTKIYFEFVGISMLALTGIFFVKKLIKIR